MARIPDSFEEFEQKIRVKYGVTYTEDEREYLKAWYEDYSFNAFVIECVRDGLLAPKVLRNEGGELEFQFDIKNLTEAQFSYIFKRSE